jgi:hypothetical protein
MDPNRVELNCSPSSRRVRLAVLGVAALASIALVLSSLPAHHQSPAAAPLPSARPADAPIAPSVPPMAEPDIEDVAMEEVPLEELTVRLAHFCFAMRDEFDLDPETGLRPFPVGCPQRYESF